MNGSSLLLTFTIYSSLGGGGGGVLALCVLLLYLSALGVSLLLALVVCADARLHRPMYVLLLHLALSGLLGSSCVSLSLLQHVLGGAESSLAGCLGQAFFINLYSGSTFCLLALMAYDRYVCICKPLLYHAVMAPGRLRLLLALLYLLLAASSALQVCLTSTLPLCRRSVDKLLCDSLTVSRLSCERSNLVGLVGLWGAVCFMALPCLLVLLSYCHICTVMLRLSTEAQRKALHTCSAHLLVFINFSGATFFGAAYNHLKPNASKAANIFTCVSFLLVPPLLNPIIYGIKMKEIRLSIRRMRRRVLQQR